MDLSNIKVWLNGTRKVPIAKRSILVLHPSIYLQIYIIKAHSLEVSKKRNAALTTCLMQFYFYFTFTLSTLVHFLTFTFSHFRYLPEYIYFRKCKNPEERERYHTWYFHSLMTRAFWHQNIQSTSLDVLRPFHILDPILRRGLPVTNALAYYKYL